MLGENRIEDVWTGRVVITGGAGFIGGSFARHLVRAGVDVAVLDNFSRAGTRANAEDLRSCDGYIEIIDADVRDAGAVANACSDAEVIIHLAGQTAVTRSILDPRGDFLDNCVGTLNVLEAARAAPGDPIVLYASTNKVYGSLAHLDTIEEDDHHRFAGLRNGIDEFHPLDFVSPYGCSKGAAERYVIDYARTFGLRTVAFRQSCIYGEHQLGVEDQGWVAWFVLALQAERPITVFGDGKQVRDLLHVDDLFRCFTAAVARIDEVSGEVFNVGGGKENSLSVWWQLAPLLTELFGRRLPEPAFGPRRLGDQLVFVSDISKARSRLGWAPTISPRVGLERLIEWIESTVPRDA